MTSSSDYLPFLPYYVNEAVSLVTFAGSAYLAWRAVRAYERRGVEPERLQALASRLQSLEATFEGVEGQVRQTVEAQRFTTALLIGSSGVGDPPDRRPPAPDPVEAYRRGRRPTAAARGTPSRGTP